VFVAVEAGWATTLAAGSDRAHGSFAFGARGGWQFSSGLALHLRYDDLGVRPGDSRSPLQLATAGLRYSVPFIVPLPFAEVNAGPSFVAGGEFTPNVSSSPSLVSFFVLGDTPRCSRGHAAFGAASQMIAPT
jgi:hypothetical protein